MINQELKEVSVDNLIGLENATIEVLGGSVLITTEHDKYVITISAKSPLL